MIKNKGFFSTHPLRSAFCITLLCFAAVHIVVPLYFFNPDDRFAMFAISGYYNGVQQTVFPFFNTVFCSFVALLYRAVPTVAWYPLVMEAFVFVSCWSIQYCLMKCAQKKNLPLWAAALVFLVLYFGLLLPMTITITFTMVSTLCGIAGILLLLTNSDMHRALHKIILSAASICLLFFSYIIRSDSGLVCLSFYALTGGYLVLRWILQKPHLAKDLLLIIICLCLVVGLSLTAALLDYHAKDRADYQACSVWNDRRSDLIDFKELSYQQDPAFFESIGWNEPYYDLVMSWYFADSLCDTAELSAIHQRAQAVNQQTTIGSSIRVMVATLFSLCKTPHFISCFILLLLSSAAYLILALRSERQYRLLQIGFLICALGGMVLMWLYLSYIGRFIGHVFRVCTIPAILLILLAAFRMLPERSPENAESNKRSVLYGWAAAAIALVLASAIIAFGNYLDSRQMRFALLGIAAILAFLLICYCAHSLFPIRKLRNKLVAYGIVGLLSLCWAVTVYSTGALDASYPATHLKEQTIEQYAIDHPKSVLVSANFVKDKYAFMVYPEAKPTNLFIIFDYLKHTEAADHKLSLYGLDELTISSYFEPNVFYIGSTKNDQILDLLLAYMKTEYGENVTATVYCELENGVSVFQFQK